MKLMDFFVRQGAQPQPYRCTARMGNDAWRKKTQFHVVVWMTRRAHQGGVQPLNQRAETCSLCFALPPLPQKERRPLRPFFGFPRRDRRREMAQRAFVKAFMHRNKKLKSVAGDAGFEPTADGFKGHCSAA
jgi:hypothetical protein